MNYGMNVKIKFTKKSAYYCSGTKGLLLNNITEIYYNFKSALLVKQIAFESDIHGTGETYFFDEIKEYEAKLATKKNDNF